MLSKSTRIFEALIAAREAGMKVIPVSGRGRIQVRELCRLFGFERGIGIPAAELPQLFQRFFRASTAKGIPGTGIGLALVHELVQRHDGRITVESEPGRGTCFTVTLPLLREAAPARAAPG